MAFSGFASLGNNNAPGAATGSGATSQGPDLELIQTEGLGFLTLAGDAKVRLTSPWSPPPAPTASLLSIASNRGLVAAAGPDGVVVASTESVRKAFEKPQEGDSDVREFEPQLKLSLPLRICQLAFTADENYLVMSAEQGGGLAVYEVQALQQGSTEPAFQIPTNGEPLRALVPNPNSEMAKLCAVVTEKGKLLMADMKERNFTAGRNGQVLREQVSCISWSNKGKQLVAGLGDGTIAQMTPEGEVKAEIPRPPSLDTSYFVEFLLWLENNLFIACHVSTAQQPPTEKCHLITRQGQNFQFQQFSDPVPVDPFAGDKTPHHTVARLKDFDPNLQDLLVFSSTASSDIGLASRSKTPLTTHVPAEKVTNVFTTTELADDSRRATLPMGDGMETPVPIGTALDLSSKDKVYRPIPADELDLSPGPLPGYWVLNAEGVLCAWWVVYSESIRGGTTYKGLAAVKGNEPTPSTAAASQTAQPSPFSAATASPFGSSAPSSTPAFGGPSTIGAKSSPWAAAGGGSAFGSSPSGTGATSSAPTFGKPSFGAPSAPAFGQASGIGMKASPWASASGSGQSAFASVASGSGGAFGSSNSNNAASSSGFASFANKGGFGQLGSNINANAPSIFASTSKSEAPEVSMDTDSSTSFPPPSSKPSTAGSVFAASPFKLQSSFQRDPNAKDDDIKPDNKALGGGKSVFGSTFGSALSETTQPTKPNPFATATESPFGQASASTSAESTTPTSTPAPNKFFSPVSTTPKSGTLFGSTTPGQPFSSITSHTPRDEVPTVKAEAQTPKPSKEVPLPPESTSKATYSISDSSSSSVTADSPEKNLSEAKEAPLPPESSPAAVDDAPLPPDPLKNKKVYDVKIPPLPETVPDKKPVDDAPLPPDPVKQSKAYDVKFPAIPGSKQPPPSVLPAPKASDKPFVFPSNPPPALSDSDDDDELSEEDEGTEAATEGSGVDVAKDLSPSSTGMNKTPGFTPTSSFDGLGGSFSTISRPDHERRGLFGEIGRNAPIFPRPNVVSPRSPSPVRNAVPSRLLGKELPRSFSTPSMASQILDARRQQAGAGSSIAGKAAGAEDGIMERQRKAKAKKQAEESQLLIDQDDDAIQQLLKSPVEPTLGLDEFIAHSGATAPAGDSIPAQVEAVYRDINSMIDTLGLNARSLHGFIEGHRNLGHAEMTKHDLSSPDDWTLGQIESLTSILERDLGDALHHAKVADVEGKLVRCAELQRELVRDRNKQADLKKTITSRLDPDQVVANRALPLSAEQAAQQNDLRREFARFTKLLAEAEENLTLLKAKIVSANGGVGGAGGKTGASSPAPTIEAVVRTITKMTSMVEKRSGDVDVLENQMRKLRLGSVGPGSRESSPFAAAAATPSKNGHRKLGSSTPSTLFSPERSIIAAGREGTPQRSSAFRLSLSGSCSLRLSGGAGGTPAAAVPRTPPRKKLSGFGDAERAAVTEKRERRAAVLGKLRGSLQKKGVSVLAVEDAV
ncbi:hypothetical protein DL762_002413 [Monosporascus cannonballus]|uniref:Nucleoporin Nup159/Nup146 N-terminal domain-containing protein n=1 Tax=Monosporascus cannonballus TaxID=155416 RepID=A0ABY0HDP6_9PEZI|nr:hypothetical protein DL763_006951 [Monosporascus cannonballus]RYO91117.1 hypothetical protein DL762_002413 [Monosporascus cannonballus]